MQKKHAKKAVFRDWRNQKLIFEERDPQKAPLHMMTSRMVPKLWLGDFPSGLWSCHRTEGLGTPSKKKIFFFKFLDDF
jgi:hypothetical protein